MNQFNEVFTRNMTPDELDQYSDHVPASFIKTLASNYADSNQNALDLNENTEIYSTALEEISGISNSLGNAVSSIDYYINEYQNDDSEITFSDIKALINEEIVKLREEVQGIYETQDKALKTSEHGSIRV